MSKLPEIVFECDELKNQADCILCSTNNDNNSDIYYLKDLLKNVILKVEQIEKHNNILRDKIDSLEKENQNNKKKIIDLENQSSAFSEYLLSQHSGSMQAFLLTKLFTTKYSDEEKFKRMEEKFL